MNVVFTPISRKAKWRLGLLAVVGIVVLLPALFLVAGTFAKPQEVQLALPAGAASTPVGAPAEALTILLGSGHQLHYYLGTATPTTAADLHTVAPDRPIRQIVQAWQRQHGKATVFIKPTAHTSYKAMVDMLDELNIVGQRSYAVETPTAADRQLLLAVEQR